MFQSEWSYKWDQISGIRSNEKGIEFTVPSESKGFKLFASKDTGKRQIIIGNEHKKEKLVKLMTKLMTSYNNP